MHEEYINVGTAGHVDHGKTVVMLGRTPGKTTAICPTGHEGFFEVFRRAPRRVQKAPNHARRSRSFKGYNVC